MNQTVKNKIIPAAIFLVCFTIAFFLAKNIFSKDVEGELTRVAEKMNKECPKQLDVETRLDGTMSLGNKTVQYNLTLVNVNRDNPAFTLGELSAALQENCQKTLDSNPGMQAFRENDVAMKYIYNDSIGRRLFAFTVKPTKTKT